MVSRYEQEEAQVAEQKIERVQQLAAGLEWNLGKGRVTPSLSTNDLYTVEFTQVPVSSPPRLRDPRPPHTFLLDMLTMRLADGRGGLLAVWSSPEPVLKANIEDAKAALAKAKQTQKLSDGCQLEKDIAELKRSVELLVASDDHKELAKVATKLDEFTARMAATRAHREAAVRDAQAKLDAAEADLDMLRQAEHRSLIVERDPWTTANSFSNELIAAHERSERVRAVDCKSIDLTRWKQIDVERAPLPFPIGWLKMLVPVELPDIKKWVSERYEEVDADSPASAGLAVGEIHQAYLKAHNLHVSQCTLESFSKIVGEAFTRKRSASGSRFMLQLKVSEAEREARLRAQFESEKAARERDEFEAWKRARVPAPAAE